MHLPRRLYHGMQGWNLLGKLAMFGLVNIAQCPSVFEGGPRRFAADRGGIAAVGIERRIEIDEINARMMCRLSPMKIVLSFQFILFYNDHPSPFEIAVSPIHLCL